MRCTTVMTYVLTEGEAGALLGHAVEGHSEVRIARTEVGQTVDSQHKNTPCASENNFRK